MGFKCITDPPSLSAFLYSGLKCKWRHCFNCRSFLASNHARKWFCILSKELDAVGRDVFLSPRKKHEHQTPVLIARSAASSPVGYFPTALLIHGPVTGSMLSGKGGTRVLFGRSKREICPKSPIFAPYLFETVSALLKLLFPFNIS